MGCAKLWMLAVAVSLLAAFSQTAQSASISTTVVLGGRPHTSSQGVPPTQTNPPPASSVDADTVSSGGSINDTIPIDVCRDFKTTRDLTTGSDQVVLDNSGATEFDNHITATGSLTQLADEVDA